MNTPHELKVVNSKWSIPLKKNEKESIIEAYSAFKNVNFFDSNTVRLEKIDSKKKILTLSKVKFYDFLLTNIIGGQLHELCSFSKNQHNDTCVAAIKKLKNFLGEKKDFATLEDLINKGNYSNALAVSVLIMDVDNNFLLTKRSPKVGIGSNLYSVTATGAMDIADCCSEKPFFECAKRELQEELNISEFLEYLELEAIVAGKEKLQPIVVLTGKIKVPFMTVANRMKVAKDYSFETSGLISVSADNIEYILSKGDFTEAGRYHLSAAN